MTFVSPLVTARVSVPGLHCAPAQQRACIRGGDEIEECLREFLLFRYRQNAGREPDGVLQFLWQRADVVGAFDRYDDVDLLQPISTSPFATTSATGAPLMNLVLGFN